MKIGLVGLHNSGKTTIFNALTGADAAVTAYASQKAETHIAVIDVNDERVEKLTDMYQPRKTTYASIEIADFAGFSEGVSPHGGFPSSFIALAKTMDALALVVRNFTDDAGTTFEPLRDINMAITEFILSDLLNVENRLERIESLLKRGKGQDALLRERQILSMIKGHLEDNRPVRTMNCENGDEALISGLQHLTQKPLMVIVNSDEDHYGKNGVLMKTIAGRFPVVEFAGKFEMELSRLDEEEGREFMADMGIYESARARITRKAYEMLGCISFLTVGTDEVRAWTIHQGDTALKAAQRIHSDLARGFIRAECFSYDNLMECGSEKGVRDHGFFRLEGRDYIVRDGDILSVRFSV